MPDQTRREIVAVHEANKAKRYEAIKKEKIQKLKKEIEKDMQILSLSKKDFDNTNDPHIKKLILTRWSNEVKLCAKRIEELNQYE